MKTLHFRQGMRAVCGVGLAVLLLSCAARAPHPESFPPELRADLEPARELIWQQRADEALQLLEESGWQATGSVAAERLRQDLAMGRGERAQLSAELQKLASLHGTDPDFLYLSARLLSDPERRLRALEEGARAHPGHAWLTLGAAATQQEFGRWDKAEAWLAKVPPDAASAFFHRLLLARQQAQGGRMFAAWRLLEEDAFGRGHSEALLECIQLAEQLGSDRRRARAATEYALRAAAGNPDRGAGMDRVIERFLAEEPWMRGASLNQVLAYLDRWCGLAGVPSGWLEQPRYSVGGLAELVQPESFRGGVTRAWLEQGRFLLIGQAPGRGVDWLYLQGAQRLVLPMPTGLPGVEVIVAQRGLEPEDRTIPGGAPFHGFFVRMDLVNSSARSHEREVAAFRPLSTWNNEAMAPSALAGSLETFDLATRLRARRLAAGGASAHDLELLHLVLHESGHLPETLRWAREGVSVLGVAPAALRSLLRYQDPILFLEERAQLRALASGIETTWAFAELLDRAHSPRDPYYAPYRFLLKQLVARGQSAGLPALCLWDQIEPERIARLAAELLEDNHLDPLPVGLVASALRGLDASKSFDQLPAQDLALRLEHHGEIQP